MKRCTRWLMIPWLAVALATPLLAGDWPQFGHDASRNMVSTEKNLPEAFNPGKITSTGDFDPAGAQNVKWTARLGINYYGNVTVSAGKVFLGTNNEPPRNPDRPGDFGVLLCLDEATGKFLWQLTVPKLGGGKAVDYEAVGLCCSPTVEGDRVYIVTNRCEVVCVTTDGLAKKNEGPFTDEEKYVGAPVGSTDADIVWRYDMLNELGVIPHQQTSSSVLVVGDKLFVTTSNGTDFTDKHIPAPGAPALICLDKKTGKLLGEEKSGISARTFKCNWSSPAYGKAGDREMVIFGGGDGFCYGFDPNPDSNGTLRELWRCDCNAPGRRVDADGKLLKHSADAGPNEITATPVFVNGRVYVAVGQDPDSGDGAGGFVCIDASKSGNITETGKLWTYATEDMHRSMSTAAVADGLVYVADYSGIVHCLNADTGEVAWTHDVEGKVWGAALVADGKVYVGNDGGVLTILAAGKQKKAIGKITFEGALLSTPIAANGVLYVGSDKQLYALQKK